MIFQISRLNEGCVTFCPKNGSTPSFRPIVVRQIHGIEGLAQISMNLLFDRNYEHSGLPQLGFDKCFERFGRLVWKFMSVWSFRLQHMCTAPQYDKRCVNFAQVLDFS